jgi:hypothetical protein
VGCWYKLSLSSWRARRNRCSQKEPSIKGLLAPQKEMKSEELNSPADLFAAEDRDDTSVHLSKSPE